MMPNLEDLTYEERFKNKIHQTTLKKKRKRRLNSNIFIDEQAGRNGQKYIIMKRRGYIFEGTQDKIAKRN